MQGLAGRAVAVVFVTGQAEDHIPTVASLRRAHPDLPILCGSLHPSALSPLVEVGASAVLADSAGALVNRAWESHCGHILLVDGQVTFPSPGITAAVGVADDDLRVATVSLLSNAAGWLSFPYRNMPTSQLPPGLDEEVVTRRLRTAPDVAPVPIGTATGPAVLLSAMALSALAPLTGLSGITPDVTITEFSDRGRQKGFVDVCDPSTFCLRFAGGPVGLPGRPGAEPAGTEALAPYPFLATMADDDRTSENSPLGIAHRLCRTKVLGLHVLIDGSCLGPREMGTQIQTLALVRALARRDDVERVHVALSGPAVGSTRQLALDAKVELRVAPGGDLSGFPPVDVFHRPFQPDAYMDMGSWPAARRGPW